MRRINIFDATLRDGDQAAGFAFSAEQKISLARALVAAGADIIETGFPLSSPADFEVCRMLAEEFPGRTAVMCRGRRDDIAETAKVFAGLKPGLLHISLPVSKIHIEAKLEKTEKELLAIAAELTAFAADLVPAVELGAEDATRAERNFLLDYCGTAVAAGAKIINIADTLGFCSPGQFGDLVAFLHKGVPGFAAGEVLLSVHCHNDFGLATANTLAAVEAGCAQVEVSVSGIGERAGNASLEEIYANLAARPELYQAEIGIIPEKLGALIKLTAELSGTAGSPLKPVSGWNIRAHSVGIHQQGLVRNTETYSTPVLENLDISPERIVLSRNSGQAGLRLFAERYCGIKLEDAVISPLMDRIKAAPGPLTGITEFLCMLSDICPGSPPSRCFRPLVCLTLTEAMSVAADTPKDSRYKISVSAALFGTFDHVRSFTGEGESRSAILLKAILNLTGKNLRINKIAMNGSGSKIRLYAEIIVLGDADKTDDSDKMAQREWMAPSGAGQTSDDKFYAVERIGNSAALLLFECCLDAVNGAAGKNLQDGKLVR
jgi:2-isopropylmalate synthase